LSYHPSRSSFDEQGHEGTKALATKDTKGTKENPKRFVHLVSSWLSLRVLRG